jgi:LysR family transcriptional regulator, nitrogen assimilation regulatory protein
LFGQEVPHNSPPLAGVATMRVLHEHLVVAYRPSAEGVVGDRDPKPLCFRNLADILLILPSLPHGTRRLIEREAIRHGTRLNVVLEVDSVAMSKFLVRRGFGSTILALTAVDEEVARRARHPPDQSPAASVYPRDQHAGLTRA